MPVPVPVNDVQFPAFWSVESQPLTAVRVIVWFAHDSANPLNVTNSGLVPQEIDSTAPLTQ